jgi:hypothetical protein
MRLVQPDPDRAVTPDPERAVPVEETVDGVPVLAAEVRALEPVARRSLPAVQAAAVAATGFVAGAATVVAIRRGIARERRLVPARRRRRAQGEALTVVGTRSFLVDVHLLGRE